MESPETEKSKVFHMADIIDYGHNLIINKIIMRRETGHVTVVSFDSGQVLKSKVLPFDTLIYLIEGQAEILIEDRSNMLGAGEAIIIPAHSRNTIKSHIQFKMISIIIKSGYRDVII